MTVAERIREKRLQEKLKQEELANIVDVSVKTIQRWETSNVTPNASKMKLLADALNTTVAYLSGETDNAERKAQPPKTEDSPKENTRGKYSYMTDFHTNRGTLVYKFANGQELEVPATPEYAPQFWARVDRLIGLQPTAATA